MSPSSVVLEPLSSSGMPVQASKKTRIAPSTPAHAEAIAWCALRGVLQHAPTSSIVTQGFRTLHAPLEDPLQKASLLLEGAELLLSSQKSTWRKSFAFLRACHEAGWTLSPTLRQKHPAFEARTTALWDTLCQQAFSSFLEEKSVWKHKATAPLMGTCLSMLFKVVPPAWDLKVCVTDLISTCSFPLLDALRLASPAPSFPALTPSDLEEALLRGLREFGAEVAQASKRTISSQTLGERLHAHLSSLTPELPSSFFENIQSAVKTLAFQNIGFDTRYVKDPLIQIMGFAHQAHERACLASTLSEREAPSRRPRL